MAGRWKPSIVGFACGASIFVALNIHSYHLAIPEDDLSVPFGVPFQMGGFGGYVGHTYFIRSGVFGNIFVALCVSAALAWLASKLWPLTVNLGTQVVAWHRGNRL